MKRLLAFVGVFFFVLFLTGGVWAEDTLSFGNAGRILLPEGFAIKTTSGGIIAKGKNMDIILFASRTPVMEKVDLKAISEAFVSAEKEDKSNYRLISRTFLKKQGFDTVKFISSFTGCTPSEKMSQELYLIITPLETYMIGFVSPSAAYNKNKTLYEKIFNSFQLEFGRGKDDACPLNPPTSIITTGNIIEFNHGRSVTLPSDYEEYEEDSGHKDSRLRTFMSEEKQAIVHLLSFDSSDKQTFLTVDEAEEVIKQTFGETFGKYSVLDRRTSNDPDFKMIYLKGQAISKDKELVFGTSSYIIGNSDFLFIFNFLYESDKYGILNEEFQNIVKSLKY